MCIVKSSILLAILCNPVTNPRLFTSVEVVVRAEAVERAQAGDRCDFTGTLIVVPDVSAMNMPGARAESSSRHGGGKGEWWGRGGGG